ncbi:MAG TPA: RpoL/Rpb11 RNA polymerase subunit family protein [Candidatus Thermoplasmatota archaeon]|nr:RpoL/Rpb11 RNA polymerase subunit family protein [Candidatus Thermoplasmatota archaeon]
MEIKLLKKTDTTLELELATENETLLNLLKQKLLENEKVVTASFLIGHPLLDKPKLVLETVKGAKPDAVVKAAAKELRASVDEFASQFSRAVG